MILFRFDFQSLQFDIAAQSSEKMICLGRLGLRPMRSKLAFYFNDL
jgi:hypothetical protein